MSTHIGSPPPTKAQSSTRVGVRSKRVGASVRTILRSYVSLLALLAVIVGYFSVTAPGFATTDNFLLILESSAPLLVVSIGLTVVMLAGGFDLSIGGVLALSSVVMAQLIVSGWPAAVAIAVVVIGGAGYGAVFNGVPVARLKVNFFVITLGSLALTNGLALKIAGGASIPLYDSELLRQIGSGRAAGISISVLVALGILMLAFVIARHTGFGRMIYAVGGNAEAARLSGINVLAIRISAYAIGSGLAAVGGVLLSGRLASASPESGEAVFLSAAAAVLIGGTSFAGGSGSVFGTFLGVLFLGVLANGLLVSGTSVLWQGVVTGAVLIASAILDRARRQGGYGGH